MLTAAQQHAVDEFAKSLSALGDDALIDTYHQAWEDHTEASAEGSDNLSKTYAKGLATEKAMQDRFPDYQSRLPATLSVNQLVPRCPSSQSRISRRYLGNGSHWSV